jgi:hypothetical protein
MSVVLGLLIVVNVVVVNAHLRRIENASARFRVIRRINDFDTLLGPAGDFHIEDFSIDAAHDANADFIRRLIAKARPEQPEAGYARAIRFADWPIARRRGVDKTMNLDERRGSLAMLAITQHRPE